MKAVKNNYLAQAESQNVYEIFADYLDAIYFDGYADQLAEENPQTFNFEFSLFISNHL